MSEETKNQPIVEDAPFNVDLDSLLGDDFLDSAEPLTLMEQLEPDSSEPVPEEVMEYPYFTISSKHMVDILRISSTIAQSSGRDIVSRAIGLFISEDRLVVNFTDYDHFIVKDFPLIRHDPEFKDFIVLSLPIMTKLVRVCPTTITVYKKDGKFHIKLIGADLELETAKLTPEQLKDKEEKYKDIGTLPTVSFIKSLKSLYVLASSAVSPAQRRIFVGGRSIASVFLFSVAKFSHDKDLPDMDLSLKAIKILYLLLQGCETTELKVSKIKNRVQIKGDDFTFSFLVSEFRFPQQLVDSMKPINDAPAVTVNTDHLSRISELSYGLIYSTTRMEFNYTPTGHVSCVMRTKRSDGNFIIKGEPNLEATPLENPIGIQANILKSLLGVFTGRPTVSMSLTNSGIGLSDGTFYAVLYTETQE